MINISPQSSATYIITYSISKSTSQDSRHYTSTINQYHDITSNGNIIPSSSTSEPITHYDNISHISKVAILTLLQIDNYHYTLYIMLLQ